MAQAQRRRGGDLRNQRGALSDRQLRQNGTVSTALREWIRGHGEDADTISSAQAVKWLSCAEHARLCAKMAEVPLGKRGPSSRRPAVAERFRVGRAVRKAFNRMQGLRGSDGQMIQDPARVDQMLWDSRKELWGSAPPMPELADTILQACFRGRSAPLPDVPRPCSRDIAGHILVAGGSAPGHTGIPYEAYVPPGRRARDRGIDAGGARCTSRPRGPRHHVGAECGFLLWIPKKAGADRPDGQRPLQLPTCFRRFFGSVITSMVAPQVEPRFSEWQASVKGGCCAKNITSAFDHLGGFDEPAHGPTGALWRGVIGDAAEGAEAACAHVGRAGFRTRAPRWSSLIRARLLSGWAWPGFGRSWTVGSSRRGCGKPSIPC